MFKINAIYVYWIASKTVSYQCWIIFSEYVVCMYDERVEIWRLRITEFLIDIITIINSFPSDISFWLKSEISCSVFPFHLFNYHKWYGVWSNAIHIYNWIVDSYCQYIIAQRIRLLYVVTRNAKNDRFSVGDKFQYALNPVKYETVGGSCIWFTLILDTGIDIQYEKYNHISSYFLLLVLWPGYKHISNEIVQHGMVQHTHKLVGVGEWLSLDRERWNGKYQQQIHTLYWIWTLGRE